MTDSTQDPQRQFGEIIDNLGAYVQHQKEEGQQHLKVSPDNVHELGQVPAAPVAQNLTPTPAPAPPVDAISDNHEGMEDIAARVAACTGCHLYKERTKTVPGEGCTHPEIAFVGEGPGADEDQQGRPFVGRAGKLLTKIITAMGFTRDEIWIGNIVKCRPPGNRAPLPDEMEACLPYLKEQLALLKPKVIVCMGGTAVKGLLEVQTGITKLRGTWMTFEDIDVMPTFHPAYLLRNSSGKKPVWEDMKAVLERLGREPPKR